MANRTFYSFHSCHLTNWEEVNTPESFVALKGAVVVFTSTAPEGNRLLRLIAERPLFFKSGATIWIKNNTLSFDPDDLKKMKTGYDWKKDLKKLR